MHVSSQEELPLADGAVGTTELAGLEELSRTVPADAGDEQLTEFLQKQLIANPDLMDQVRCLAGISDKRLYLDLSYVFSRTPHPTENRTLCGCLPSDLTRHQTSYFKNKLRGNSPGRERSASANVIAGYFIQREVGSMLRFYSKLEPEHRRAIIANLIDPKEAQQNEAKRRGHGSEVALASLVQSLGCNFLPEDKLTNPMGGNDPNVDRVSFVVTERNPGRTFSSDLVLLDGQGNVQVCVLGLVQSSDPGQFGVDKCGTCRNVREAMDVLNRRREANRQLQLWGVVDGVGYSENKNGTINPMLPQFHTFVQAKSLYKAGLALHSLGRCVIVAIKFNYEFYTPHTAQQMIERYVPNGIRVLADGDQVHGLRAIQAGWATLFV